MARPRDLDGSADLSGQNRRFARDATAVFTAEASTGRRYDDPHQLLVEVERRRDLGARREGGLGPDPHRESPIVVPDRQCTTGLKGRGRDVGGRVRGLTAQHRRREGPVGISLLDVDRTGPTTSVSHRVVTQELFQIVVRWCGGYVPSGSQTGECRARHDRVAGHDANQRVRAQAANGEVRHETSRARDRVNHSFGHVRRAGQMPLGARQDSWFASDDFDLAQTSSHRQQGPRVGRRLGERVTGVGHRTAPEGSHVVGAEIGVPHRQSDVRQGNTQFLGDQET